MSDGEVDPATEKGLTAQAMSGHTPHHHTGHPSNMHIDRFNHPDAQLPSFSPPPPPLGDGGYGQ